MQLNSKRFDTDCFRLWSLYSTSLRRGAWKEFSLWWCLAWFLIGDFWMLPSYKMAHIAIFFGETSHCPQGRSKDCSEAISCWIPVRYFFLLVYWSYLARFENWPDPAALFVCCRGRHSCWNRMHKPSSPQVPPEGRVKEGDLAQRSISFYVCSRWYERWWFWENRQPSSPRSTSVYTPLRWSARTRNLSAKLLCYGGQPVGRNELISPLRRVLRWVASRGRNDVHAHRLETSHQL